MAPIVYTSPAGYGEFLSTRSNYSQAARLPSHIVKTSGQGGWDPLTGNIPKPSTPADLTAQIEQAFSNVDGVLKHAGLRGWEDVYLVRAFVLNPRSEGIQGVAGACMRKWCPNHTPLLTWIGVAQLAFEDMIVEIEVEAFDHAAASIK